MRKSIIVLFFLMCVGSLFMGNSATEAVTQRETDVGIAFKKMEKDDVQPPNNVGTMKPTGKLPSTGELITSVIWMLLGTTILIFFVGMISLKTIMSNNLWERVC